MRSVSSFSVSICASGTEALRAMPYNVSPFTTVCTEGMRMSAPTFSREGSLMPL